MLVFKFWKSFAAVFALSDISWNFVLRSANFSSADLQLSLILSINVAIPDIIHDTIKPIPIPITALSAVVAILKPIVAAFDAMRVPIYPFIDALAPLRPVKYLPNIEFD